jgi:hypothetical protein
MEFQAGNHTFTVRLTDVKHAPDALNNILSVGRLMDMEHIALFTNDGVKFCSQNGTVFAEGHKVGCVYIMHAQIHPAIQMDFAAVAKPKSWDSWHQVLVPVNIGVIELMKSWDLVTGMDVDTAALVMQCIACIQGKHHVEPFPKRMEDAAALVGDLSVSDVWGLVNTEGPAQEQYFYSFTNTKAGTPSSISVTPRTVSLIGKEYAALVEMQKGNQLKRLCSDGGGEYINAPFRAFCAEKGIIMESTTPYSPAQNGITRCLNCTLLEHARM